MLAHFKYPAYYQLCTVEATIDTEASAEAHFAKELECVKVWEHQHQLVQLCSYECESFCSHTRCAADNSLFFLYLLLVYLTSLHAKWGCGLQNLWFVFGCILDS